MIHCDAGPNIVRAYPVENDGAGYKASIVPVLEGKRDQWFRPIDVCTAPDGSIFIADWYDPGVGGHQMGDLNRGRIYRLAPTSGSYAVPKLDLTTPLKVLLLPCKIQTLPFGTWPGKNSIALGAQAEPALQKLWASDNPRFRARALWLLAKCRVKKASTSIRLWKIKTAISALPASVPPANER
jgi:hypothetical protein